MFSSKEKNAQIKFYSYIFLRQVKSVLAVVTATNEINSKSSGFARARAPDLLATRWKLRAVKARRKFLTRRGHTAYFAPRWHNLRFTLHSRAYSFFSKGISPLYALYVRKPGFIREARIRIFFFLCLFTFVMRTPQLSRDKWMKPIKGFEVFM